MKKLIIPKLEKRQKKDWKKLAIYWKLFTECARPSRNDMEIIGHIINEKINKRIERPVIVIFGSTPEYRDLTTAYAIHYGAKIICVELVKDMYTAMGELISLKNKKEEVIFKNWLSTGLPDNFADIVIGDLTEGNIEEKLKSKYLSEINRILKKDGKYITRHAAYILNSENKPLISLEQIKKRLEEYKQKVLVGELTMRQAGNYLGAELLCESFYKSNGEKISLSVYDYELNKINEEKIKAGHLGSEILRILYEVWGPIKDKYWEYNTLDKTINNFKNYFKDIKYNYSKDYPTAKYSPIFEMIKK